MPVQTPSWDDFTALEERVAALEAGTPEPQPPEPEPEPPGEGVQATRVCALIEQLGVNTFSSLDPNANLWGSWPADYSPPSVLDGLRYCWPASAGFTPPLREYHYAGREVMQDEWLRQLRAALPGLRSTFCVGANGDVGDAETMLGLYADEALGIRWIEGLNEPNTDFGSGVVPIERTMDIQRRLLTGCNPDDLMGPSIVFGMPHPAGWIEGYCGEHLEELNASLAIANGHFYPPKCPDVPHTGYSLDEVTGELWTVYGNHPVYYTEFHPTLYGVGTRAVKAHIAAAAGRARQPPPAVPSFRASATRDPYYTLLTMLRTRKQGCGPVWWYALYDYASVYQCGLFPVRHADHPTTTAQVLRHLAICCTDDSATSHTFTPGRLGVRVSGLPAHGDWDLYQASSGAFLLPIWLAADDPGGGDVTVTVEFDAALQWITDIDLLAMRRVGETAVRTDRYVASYQNGVRLLVIEP